MYMKMGFRKPSLKKSIKASTTGRAKRALKSAVNPLYGKKGTGFITNPKKSVYNKVYSKTTASIIPNGKPGSKPHEEYGKIPEDNVNKINQKADKIQAIGKGIQGCGCAIISLIGIVILIFIIYIILSS